MILAATGHRPNKLGGYGIDVRERLRALANEILVELKPEEVISGMALGWDTAWAEAAIVLHIRLVAAVPFAGQENQWPITSRLHYRKLLARANEVEIVCEGRYAPWKMHKRNAWMVDNADTLVALWDGSNGGTGNCVQYAKTQAKPILNVWPRWAALAHPPPL